MSDTQTNSLDQSYVIVVDLLNAVLSKHTKFWEEFIYPALLAKFPLYHHLDLGDHWNKPIQPTESSKRDTDKEKEKEEKQPQEHNRNAIRAHQDDASIVIEKLLGMERRKAYNIRKVRVLAIRLLQAMPRSPVPTVKEIIEASSSDPLLSRSLFFLLQYMLTMEHSILGSKRLLGYDFRQTSRNDDDQVRENNLSTQISKQLSQWSNI
jgi:hypothetical protein